MGQGKFSLRAAPKVVTSVRWALSRRRHEEASNLSRSPGHSSNSTTRATTFTSPYVGRSFEPPEGGEYGVGKGARVTDQFKEASLETY